MVWIGDQMSLSSFLHPDHTQTQNSQKKILTVQYISFRYIILHTPTKVSTIFMWEKKPLQKSPFLLYCTFQSGCPSFSSSSFIPPLNIWGSLFKMGKNAHKGRFSSFYKKTLTPSIPSHIPWQHVVINVFAWKIKKKTKMLFRNILDYVTQSCYTVLYTWQFETIIFKKG